MNILLPSSKIYISSSSLPSAGMGVFARVDIKEGEIIEEAPILIIPDDQLSALVKTELINYFFAWGKGFKEGAIAWGYGSLFNHSYEPNANYIKDFENNMIRFVAIENISRDQEIVMNYNGHPGDKTKLWFEVRDNWRG